MVVLPWTMVIGVFLFMDASDRTGRTRWSSCIQTTVSDEKIIFGKYLATKKMFFIFFMDASDIKNGAQRQVGGMSRKAMKYLENPFQNCKTHFKTSKS